MPSLGNDLASIRKELNLSIKDIQHATKIPVHILESIEKDTILTDFEESRTYARSYVRSYARALKIDDSVVVHALDQMEEGTYSGLLMQREEEPSEEKQETQPEDPKKKQTPGKKKQDMADDHVPPSAGAKETAPSSKSAQEETQEPDDRSSLPPSLHQEDHAPPPPSVSAVDWAGLGHKFAPLRTRSRVWMGIAIIVLVLGAAVFFIFFQSDSLSDNTGSASAENKDLPVATMPSDSLQLNLTPSEAESSAAESREESIGSSQRQTSLSDTLSLVVYAAYGKLEPIRVFTDVMDSLNPYWVEQGEALRFSFVNSLRLRGQYGRMVLLFNGHIIRNFRDEYFNKNTRMVEINRSIFEDSPKWLEPAPDSLDIDAPPPVIIKDRPTFN